MPEQTAAMVFPRQLVQRLSGEVEWVPGFFTADGMDDRLGLLAGVEYLFTGWQSPCIDEAVLAAAPDLKAVFHCAGSVRHVTGDVFWERNIPIASANEANGVPVAEFTYAQIVLSLKGHWQSTKAYAVKRRIPPERKDACGLRGATVGLVSLGSIARMLVPKLKAWPLRVLAYDPYVSAGQARELGVALTSLEALFAESQVVSCHAPLYPDTEGLLQERHFLAMPPHATFINTSRGRVVDSEGLVRALRDRPDLSALLDVTDPEPLPPDSPFFGLPNAHISPHIAGSIGNECLNLGEAMIAELRRFLAGQPLQGRITREQAARMT